MQHDRGALVLCGLTILMWGLWGFFGKMALDRRMAPATMFLMEVLVSALCAVAVTFALYRSDRAVQYISSWNGFGVASGAALAFGLLFYYMALQAGRASIVVPLTASYPVVAVLLSYLILGDRPTPAQWVGIMLVIAGSLLLLSGPLGENRSAS
jgi:transporter family protein